MSFTSQANLTTQMAQRYLLENSRQQAKTLQRLASGKRIVQAGDDPAGIAIAESLRAESRGLTQAFRNANDGISMVQVVEGGLNEIGNILIRLRELSVQGASDTIGDRERGYLDQEFQALLREVDRIANVTKFNDVRVLNGENAKDILEFQVGIHASEENQVAFEANATNVTTGSLGVDGLGILEIDDARDSLEFLDQAFHNLNTNRSRLGALQNRLQSTVRHLQVTRENIDEARSRNSDVDIALEASNLAKQNILQQANMSVLSQANSVPGQVLKLL